MFTDKYRLRACLPIRAALGSLLWLILMGVTPAQNYLPEDQWEEDVGYLRASEGAERIVLKDDVHVIGRNMKTGEWHLIDAITWHSPFEGRSREVYEVQIDTSKGFAEQELESLEVGEVMILPDPNCEVFERTCGIMARIIGRTEPTQGEPCCVTLELESVGLESVIQRGDLTVEALSVVRSDDKRCFIENGMLAEKTSERGVLRSQKWNEFGCINFRHGELPRLSVEEGRLGDTPMSRPQLAGGLIAVTSPRESRRCPENSWSNQVDFSHSARLGPYGPEIDMKYQAVLHMEQTLRFRWGRFEGADLRATFCQLGSLEVTLDERIEGLRATVWGGGVGPKFFSIGMLPVMLSLTAELDILLDAGGQIRATPWVGTYSGVAARVARGPNGPVAEVERDDSVLRFEVTEGTEADVYVQIGVTPRAQINLYGAGGPQLEGPASSRIKLESTPENQAFDWLLEVALVPGIGSRLLSGPVRFRSLFEHRCLLTGQTRDIDTCWSRSGDEAAQLDPAASP